MKPYEVQVEKLPARFGYKLYVYYREPDGKTFILNADNTETQVSDGTDELKPTIAYLPEEAWQAIVNKSHEYKPAEGKFTEGKLEATESHLRDLRHLLKLPKN